MARSTVSVRRGHKSRTPLGKLVAAPETCLELYDYSEELAPAAKLFGTPHSADPQAQAARLAEQFLRQNRSVLEMLDVTIERDYDGTELWLRMQSGSRVGAVPLLSPFTARPDYGIIVKPRFEWSGIGPMLAEMGWTVSPVPLRLPLLKRSERRIPAWVLSTIVLARLKALLDQTQRRFEIARQELPAPKGTINWCEYATRQMTRGRFLAVPCAFPDLREDRDLKAAVRFTLEKQLRSLDSQREQGTFVHALIAVAEMLLRRVDMVPSRRPAPRQIDSWMRGPLHSSVLAEGLQAIGWTVDDRGLAGISDLEGIPWAMPMDQFFEAWVETVLRKVALQTGGILKSGRMRETVSPIAWNPPYLGSQRALVPDLMLESEGGVLIVDAKYKRHWEELQDRRWDEQAAGLREQHRADLLQVLAYANLTAARNVTCCLVYPCTPKTWESLERRGRLFHTADLPHYGRQVQVWLTAMPMHAGADRVAEPLVRRIRERWCPP